VSVAALNRPTIWKVSKYSPKSTNYYQFAWVARYFCA